MRRGTKRGFRRTIASLLGFSLCIAAVPARPARADNKINELQNQIKEEQKKQNDTKDQKKQTENTINSLNNVKTSLQGELNGLTDDLTPISRRLEEIEQNIIDKNQEISDTQEKLEQAKETESSQYAAMKQRLRYLYRDNNRTYYEILFSAMTFSELLNQSIYAVSYTHLPPCAIALATLLFKDKFTKEERQSGPVNFIMGLAFITEGAIPYAASDPLHVLPFFFCKIIFKK